MNRTIRLLITSVSVIGLVMFMPLKIAWAADEDIDPSVYLVFDPATGEFTTVTDPDANKSGMAGGTSHPPAQATGSTQGTTSMPVQGRQASMESSGSEGDSSGLTPLWAGIGVALVFLGGIVLFRRNQHKHNFS